MTFIEDNSPRANRLFLTSDGTLKMRDLYRILHDRLEYCRCTYDDGFGTQALSELTDIDVLCQTFCYEVEKAIGLHQDKEPDVDMGLWTGGVSPVGSASTAPEPTRVLHPGPRDKALAREELARKLERVTSGKGYTAHYLAGALLEALRNGAF